MVRALDGRPQAMEDFLYESNFDANRFQYEIDLNQHHIEAISTESDAEPGLRDFVINRTIKSC